MRVWSASTPRASLFPPGRRLAPCVRASAVARSRQAEATAGGCGALVAARRMAAAAEASSGGSSSKKQTGRGHRPTPPRPLSAEAKREKEKRHWAKKSKPTPDSRLPEIDTSFWVAASGGAALDSAAQVSASVIVERLPVVAPDFPEWKATYLQQKMEKELELEAAQERLADQYVAEQVELRQPARKKKNKAKGKGAGAGAAEPASQQQQEDDDEAFQESTTKSFPKITLEDHADNRKSLYRKLDSRLYLIVKKDREAHSWQFPLVSHAEVDGDHLRATAERGVRQQLGEDIDTYFVGNGPLTWFAYDTEQSEAASSPKKVFFYKAQYLFGNVQLGDGLVDHAWVTRAELGEYLSPEYHSHLDQALLK